MKSSPQVPWALRVSRAGSYKALNDLVDDWYETIKARVRLRASIGFESYMEARDWDGAKRSVERNYGRSSSEHQPTLDTLNAAIQCRRQMKLVRARAST